MDPLKWPVAPDGYIPNSVIRSWGMKKKVHSQTESSNDVILSHLESTTRNEEDFKTRIFWFDEEEADEEPKTADVIGRRSEFVDEKKREEAKTDIKRKEIKEDEKDTLRKLKGIMKREEEEKDRMDEKREGKIVGTDLLKSSYNIQTNTGTIHYEEMKLERSDVIPENTPNMQNGVMLCATSNTQTPMNNIKSSTMGFLSSTLGHNTGEEDLDTKLCGTSSPPFLSVTTKLKTSADVSKGPEITNYTPLTQPQDTHPQMSDPPVADQPQPDFALNGGSLFRDKVFLLSNEKNFKQQAVPPLDPKALRLFRKYKDTIKNSSHHANNTRKLHLNTHRNRSPALKSNLSSFPIQHLRIINPELPDRSLYSGSLCQSVQPEHLSVHQRVVQKIQRKDTVSGTSTLFHHVIPMAAQNSFATLKLSGTTQYGRLQFDWIRGHEEDKLLEISGAKTKDTHYVLFTNRASCHPNVFA